METNLYEPKISIIMATHNRGNIIHHAINSVLWQTYKNWELIIVLDGCTDNTLQVVASYDDKRIKRWAEPKFDYYTHVRNFGIQKAKGELLCFRDDDGCWTPDFFESMIKPHRSKDVLVTYCGRMIYDNYGLSKIEDSKELLKNVPDSHRILMQWQGHQTLADEVDVGDIMIKRSVFKDSFKGFTEDKDNPGYCSDAKLIDKIMKEYRQSKIVMIPKYMHMYFIHHDGRKQMTYEKLENRAKGSQDNELEEVWRY